MTNSVFFGEQGLTSTSANYLANIAKEWIAQQKSRIAEMQFYKTTIALIGSNAEHTLEEGCTSISFIKETLPQIINAHSYIAWLREAIKAKSELTNEVSKMTLKEWCRQQGVEMPVLPERETSITEEEIIDNLSIKERNRYFHLETICAVIGKMIHPTGSLSEARQNLIKVINKPHKISGVGRDGNIYTYTPTIDPQEVEALFFELQDQHRSAQAELNGLKHKIQLLIEEDETKKNAAYEIAAKEYAAAIATLNARFQVYITERLKEIHELKIVIPNDLLEIHTFFKNFGKK